MALNPLSRVAPALQKLAGPAAPWWNRTMVLVLALWITHGALRAAVLFRPDGFGFPLVGKADWYIFHALFLDLHWIALSALPLLALLRVAVRWNRPRVARGMLFAFFLFHAVLLLFTVADHETLRFMGMHLDPGMLRTYGNPAALRETFAFLAHDASIPGLPYVLMLGCVPLALLLDRLIRKAAWARRATWSLTPVVWLAAGSLVGYLYVYHLWTGGNRMRKLRPFIHTAYLSLGRAETPRLPASDLAALATRHSALWLAGSADTNWSFPDPSYPYYKVPTGPSTALPPAPLAPAEAAPGRPWNFVLIILESHRALNVGHLKPYGATSSATPFLDSLARTGHAWTRMVASGIPTINALMAIHLSIPQHPTRQLASEFTTLRHEAFTVPFARRGYVTRFFSAADPAWDNQTPWLRQWYAGIRYDRARENDALMFADLAAWMRDSLNGAGNTGAERPFFLTAMTKTNHYPFNPVEGVRPVADDAPLVERMDATMAYTDSSLRAFFADARTRPWFDRTVFAIVADHGFPLSEHGSSQIGYGLYTENIWLPFVVVGRHPALGTPQFRDDLAAQVDIGPTLLDLAGIREPNAFVGHSLLAPLPPDRQTRFALLHEQAFVERGRYRWHGAWSDVPREQGEELFDVVEDRREHRNLLKEKSPGADHLKALHDSLANLARALGRLHVEVLERDALLPPSPPSDTGSTSTPASAPY